MFNISYVPRSRLDAALAACRGVLAIVRYGSQDQKPLALPCPVITVPLAALDRQELVELWQSAAPVSIGQRAGIDYAADGRAFVGVCRIAEPVGSLLDDVTEAAYTDILRLVKEQGYPYLLRMWNHYDGIGRAQKGRERYQRFCLGRHRAFAAASLAGEQLFPAATVVGTRTPGLIVYFLAGREPGVAIENPRQVSAFRYPTQYSPVGPSFSRAMAKAWGTQAHLYASGTASIVGHATMHAGDTGRQLTEILRNLEALRLRAAAATGRDFESDRDHALYKIYLRDADEIGAVRAALLNALGEHAAIIYLLGDLCRHDLRVEIEALYRDDSHHS